jgi:hypothetical protein
MSISVFLNNSSWVRYGRQNVVERIGQTGPEDVSWFGPSVMPDLSDRNGDIEYTVQTGDRLDKLALTLYGSELLWWVIAAKNGLDLPAVELQPGLILVITDPSYVTTQIPGKRVAVERVVG